MKTIFLCEDDQSIREVVTILLEEQGYTVTNVAEEQNLIEKIVREKPTLLLVDLMMPQIHGKHIVKQLRNNSGTKHLPIVIMSAESTIEKIAKESGADSYIKKPFDIDELQTIVNRYAG